HLTFNLVPSLLEQLEDYAEGAEDYELMLSKMNPVDLSSEEKEAILTRFFQAHYETMINPLPRYMELLQYRGIHGTRRDIDSAMRKFAAQDFLDLQVLFNLSWFGFAARTEDVEIRRLIHKGRFFTVEDRDLVLEKQLEIIKKLVRFYQELWEKGSIDITTSPFYHPILPLLCDTSIALESMPGCLLPKQRFSHPEDAARQVEMGLKYFEERFGKKPSGMWPSEGSVSPAVLEIIRDAGITWIATDEGILSKSLKQFNREQDLYRPWNAHGIAVFFRDKILSDQIGFVYKHNTASVAVDDFVGRLKTIDLSSSDSPRCVCVILDGENPWEYFPNSGKDFLETFYARLLSEKRIKPISFERFLDENPPVTKIQSIFPGSWINCNFDTWIGDQEEADGWDALNNARKILVEREQNLSEDEKKEAWLEIFRAEGSDWFWWYGEDHTSPNDTEFDRLFRTHLERVYNILGIYPPLEVTEPIIVKQVIRADVEPTGLVTPVIDGRSTTFYEWISAGWIPTTGPAGVMSGGEPLISSIYYGFDFSSFYVRLDLTERDEPLSLLSWKVSLFIDIGSEKYRLDVKLSEPDTYILYILSKDKWVRRSRRTKIAFDRIIELGVSFRDVSAQTGMRISFMVLIYENEVEHERWPLTGRISFVVPDEKYQSMMWQL
ncbi:MAG TPA: glycoside hydrolase, partial [Anaerolineae bacterium]|nr:glycoside hydrolase [Anaerolineae bacterium]